MCFAVVSNFHAAARNQEEHGAPGKSLRCVGFEISSLNSFAVIQLYVPAKLRNLRSLFLWVLTC